MNRTSKKLVLLESPFAGDTEAHLAYCRAAMRDCFDRGEIPFASHALYTQAGVLDDLNPRERALGIGGGFAWGAHASMTVVYCDRGISRGMRLGILDALRARRPIVLRSVAANAGAIAHAAEIVERLRLAGARAIARGRARGRRAA